MKKQTLIRNIAAVSLIEIMMIFAIIGIVTAACMGLSKPKVEYMKNIRLYSALVTLEQAGKAIANEGSIFFTTDISTCTDRDASTSTCKQYTANLKNVNNQLPTISHRAASTNGVIDPGLGSTIYSSLSADEKAQFKYLQNGLCQRLADILKLNAANTNCSTNITDNKLINEPSSTNAYSNSNSIKYQKSFYGITPQLYLPNGQVAYIGKNLYNDFRASNGTITRHIVVANSNAATSSTITYDAAKGFESGTNIYETTINTAITNTHFFNLPNETRSALIKIARKNKAITSEQELSDFFNYLDKVYNNNKDYFIIYVDTDCKKGSQNDKKCGTDTLGSDIFAFRMYRDGTVILDNNANLSNVDSSKLTAKILIRQPNGRYQPDTSHLRERYTNARCLANLAGAYATGYANEHTGICGTIRPLAACYSSTGEPQCKVILNKPSFLMR